MVTFQICAKEKMVRKNINLSSLVIDFTTRRKVIKYMNVDQGLTTYLLDLYLKVIAIIVKILDIEHINEDHRQGPIGLKRVNYAPHNICSKCQKIGHSSKNCKTQVPTSNLNHIFSYVDVNLSIFYVRK